MLDPARQPDPAGLSEAAARIIDAAPIYAEGIGVRFSVASAQDLAPFAELLAIKSKAPARAARRGRRG